MNWSFDLANSEVQYLAAGETVTAAYTITITDDSGAANAANTQDVTVVITGTNDQPTIAVVDVDGAVTEDASDPTLSDNGSITFDDADATDLSDAGVALSTTSTTGPAIPASLATALTSAVTLSGDTSAAHDGTVNWSFDLANSEVQYLADGETVTAAYTITITGGQRGQRRQHQDVTVVITGTNEHAHDRGGRVDRAVTKERLRSHAQ